MANLLPVNVGMVTDLADKLGLLDGLKRKLKRQPDPAAAKLATALAEISKIYEVLDTAILQYLGLWLDAKNPELSRERATLLDLEGGRIQAEMRAAKGSCTKISNIYQAYLHPWFDRVLNRDESAQLELVFIQFRDWDTGMIQTIDGVSAWLVAEAGNARLLVDNGQLELASSRVHEAANSIRPVRKQLAKSMGTLYGLQGDFVALSGAV